MLQIIHREKNTVDVPEAEEAKSLLRDAYHGARLIDDKFVQAHVEIIFKRFCNAHLHTLCTPKC